MRELKEIGYICVGTPCIVIAAITIVCIVYPICLIARACEKLLKRKRQEQKV